MSKLATFSKTLADLGNKRVRKNPRVYPKAKGKLLKVKQPTQIDPVEYELCQKWWTDYRLQYEAVRNLFKYEIERQKMEAISASRIDHEHERNRRHELTESWNKETHLIAIDKFEKLLKALIDKQTCKLAEFENEQMKSLTKLKANVDEVATLAEQMITEKNLDDKIDEIMNSDVVDYNFVVDYKGNIVRGTKPLEYKSHELHVEEDVQDDPLSATS
ncbi:28S ribosomal mitochondrial protein [Schistosoma japonicum]|nr:28S ribosomal mitochondrial protein [Schistosoma japonicum]KAH8876803.1 28S ribosomal mitochondrial protein [Schistosoma japonicum]KAH8876804.1 28S ribosomal mitochondrial protein [Schistosoma japonicum]